MRLVIAGPEYAWSIRLNLLFLLFTEYFVVIFITLLQERCGVLPLANWLRVILVKHKIITPTIRATPRSAFMPANLTLKELHRFPIVTWHISNTYAFYGGSNVVELLRAELLSMMINAAAICRLISAICT